MLGGYHGSMHFIRFPTSEMPGFIELARSKNFPLLATTICATGGGAHKFSEEFEKVSMMIHSGALGGIVITMVLSQH